ncbi:MAG: hypothetical protein AAF466_01265 [Bacteroidota bacterium]
MLLLDICVCVIVFLVGFNLKTLIPGFSSSEQKWLARLFFYHFLIAVAFHLYIEGNGGDAVKYWNLPKNGTFGDMVYLVVNQKASSFMYFFNFFPANLLELSFFTGNMMYALLGFLGFVYLFKIIKELFGETSVLYSLKIARIPLFPLLLFLPNLHFWSSGIGKDAILFFCIHAFIFGLLKVRKRLPLIAVSLVLAVLIRPHIALFLMIAFAIGYLFDGRLKPYQRFFIIVVFIIGFVSLFGYVLQTIQLDSLEVDNIEEFANTRATTLSRDRTGSSVDISGYPIPLKIFTFLYRPLFFDVNGALAVLASVENLILLLFTTVIAVNRPLLALRKSSFTIKGMFFFFLIGTILFSFVLGNLGIMLRQKNMFIPVFLITGLWILYYRKIKQLQPT